MLFHSGRTFSSDHLDLESKLDLILKELQDLKLRVEGLENMNKEENSRDDTQDRREENTNRCRDGEDDIIHRIKTNLPTFNSILDPKFFSDWVANFDYYFDWYWFTEESRAQFARMKLSGSTMIYWTSVKRVHLAWDFHRVLGGNETKVLGEIPSRLL